jgi:iron complex transport system ATP-binding protein
MALKMDNINFSYPGQPVLHQVSCGFNTGQIHVILGPNGSGKTTLIDLMAGLSSPGQGQVRLNHTPLSTLSRTHLARKIALVSQNYNIRFPFSVKDVVLMGRHPYIDRFSSPSARDRAMAEDAMASTGIFHIKHKKVTELSGGEKQRCVFARALCQDTPYILLDEAFSSMDIHHTMHLLRILKQSATHQDKTVIAVLHDINLAATWADTLLLIKSGRVIDQGPPESVFTEENIKQVFNVTPRVAFNEFSNSFQAFFKA